MAIVIQEPNTGSDATFTKSGTSVALDVNLQSGSVTINPGDIEIGAVEIKNSSSDDRATVTANGDLQVTLDGEGVDINNPSTIGSYTGQANGSVAITNSPNVLLGSTALHGIGSVLNVGSVEVFQTTPADMAVSVDAPATIGSYTSMALGSTAITNTPNFLLGSTSLWGTGSQRVTEYGTAGQPNFYASVSSFEIPSTIIADPISATLLTIANGGAYVTGDEAHDSTDAGNPVKIGGKAQDYDPNTEGEQGPNDVAEGDRANASFNLKGELVPSVKPEYNDLDNIGDTYNNVTTTAVSSNFTCWQYRECCIGFELDKNSTPTDIVFDVEVSLDGTNYTKLMNNFLGDWRYDDTSVGSGIEESVVFPIACQKIRVRATATGTDATKTFTVANPVIYFRT